MEDEKRGKYKIIYSSGSTAIMSGIVEQEAIETAQNHKKNDPGLSLYKITEDKGGVIVELK